MKNDTNRLIDGTRKLIQEITTCTCSDVNFKLVCMQTCVTQHKEYNCTKCCPYLRLIKITLPKKSSPQKSAFQGERGNANMKRFG